MKNLLAMVVVLLWVGALAIGQDQPAQKQESAKPAAAPAKADSVQQATAPVKAEKADLEDCCKEEAVKSKEGGCGEGCGGCGDMNKTTNSQLKASSSKAKAPKTK